MSERFYAMSSHVAPELDSSDHKIVAGQWPSHPAVARLIQLINTCNETVHCDSHAEQMPDLKIIGTAGAVCARAKETVFIIDDDPAVRDALDNLAQSVGLRAVTFGTTDEFLQAKRPDAPSCLVLDVRLPNVNGLDFQGELERMGVTLPIVFISGYADVPMSVRAMKHGAIDFFCKPAYAPRAGGDGSRCQRSDEQANCLATGDQ